MRRRMKFLHASLPRSLHTVDGQASERRAGHDKEHGCGHSTTGQRWMSDASPLVRGPAWTRLRLRTASSEDPGAPERYVLVSARDRHEYPTAPVQRIGWPQ